MPTTVCTAKASLRKAPGLLELTDTVLQWYPEGKKAPAIVIKHAEANSLFCSKEGAAQVKLKIVLVNNESDHTFTFTTTPQTVAFQEREKFKRELTLIISRNKESRPATGLALPQSTAAPTPVTPVANGARPTLPRPSRPPSRAQSVSSDRGTPTIVGNDPATDFRLRKKVLLANPELASLHRDLVMSGQISEAEFWDGREHLLLAQQAMENQRKGKPGQIVDPRPETVDGGEIKIRITQQLINDIFDEYPIVEKAFQENVPSNLTEAEFWKRYFQSKLFNAHRASIRSSATQHVVREDAIFDKYLEKEDDGIEPRKQRTEKPELFLDLGATNEDHGDSTVEKDITMQAGRQRAALPLIRKFNEHSERLLNLALGELPATKRRKLDNGEDYSEIEYEDLRGNETSDGIALEMQDRQRYFEGRIGGATVNGGAQKLDFSATIREARANLMDWDRTLSHLTIERKGGDAALKLMTQNVHSRLDVRSRKNDIPDGLFRQMTTCQTAANEFLRQYWSATLPPAAELTAIAVANPAQRAAKAAKMIGYLSKTQEKVNTIVQVARQHGIDGNKIENAMKPMLDAVNHALTFHKNKEAAAAARRAK